MNDRSHWGYKPFEEDEKYLKEKVLRDLDTHSKAQKIIDDWSAEARKKIGTKLEFDEWVRGLTKLYEVKR